MKIFGARKGVDKDIIFKVKQALLNLDRKNGEHIKILHPAELGGFRQYSEGDFWLIKMMMSSKQAD